MDPIRKASFGRTDFLDFGNWVETVLPGGKVVSGLPNDTDAYRATAMDLGYGQDTARMCREHEMLHSALADFLGLPESPTLRLVSESQEMHESDLARMEEAAVLSLQRFANAVGVDLSKRFLG